MTDRQRYYITTAIDYANGPPHLGHALEKVGADAMARYHRLKGEQVHFVIGTDEHGQKVAQTAALEGVSPAEWTDRIAGEFRSAWQALGISNDDFVRTTEPRHRAAVEEMIRRMQAKGDLYRATYSGYYCVGCEAYKTEDELVDGRCILHPNREVEWMEEEDWFFRLSAYGERLMELVDRVDPPFVAPESRRNEVRRMVEEIKDISVSRSLLAWGIPWPGDEHHTVYVWIDALTNYLSATGFPDPSYRDVWPAAVHVIGKDIVRFHCVYWPAMLMSAEVEVPRSVWAHGFMTMGGGKISKSSGVSFTLEEAVQRHGAEALRFYLLREIPWDGDGNFGWERFDERYNADLANDLGNLANRVLSMVAKYRDGRVAPAARTELDAACEEAVAQYRTAMDANLLHEGVGAAMRLVAQANASVSVAAPWKLAKDPERAAELDSVLTSLVRSLAVAATLLSPVMPGRMEELWRRLGSTGGGIPLLDDLLATDVAGWTVEPGDPLFPR
ncbi:MAG TPA: methionine--tRNA ligase, partial [Longimicrobiaceae bacterium]|nr:methionine--tRNA ligase [Longimicrobiaceae bacterium]